MEQPEHCKACMGSRISHLKQNDGGYPEWECADCGLVFVWPIPSEQELTRFYNEAEAIVKHAVLPEVPRMGALHRMVVSFTKTQKPCVKVLDVGAGFGRLINHYKLLGHEAYAYEYSELCATFLEKHGIKCFRGRFEPGLFKGTAPFDTVFMTEVLEHVEDPEAYLRTIHSILAPGGQLCLSVPNKDFLLRKSYWASFKMNPHLSHFTEKSLRALLKRAGFANVEFHLAPYDTYDNNTGRLKSAAIAAANIAAIGIRAATLGSDNRGFQLFLRAEKPQDG